MPSFQCVHCGASVTRSPSKLRRPGRFCSKVCSGLHHRTGCTDSNGYRRVASEAGQVYEHRRVAEQILRRKLLPTEHVHHVNGNRSDNRPENLRILSDADHQAIHAPQRIDVAEAIRLHATGATCKAIGRRLGVSGETVRTHLSRAGFDTSIRRGKQFAKRLHGRYVAD